MSAIARDSAYLDSLTLDQLAGELILAANRLASVQITEPRDGWPAICHECGGMRFHRSQIVHRDDCRAGGVDRILVAMRDKTFTPQPRKETRAHQDAGAAAAGETRPQAQPFLVVDAAAAGLYGEPWALDNGGAVHDAAGNTIAEPVGCELVEPDDIRAMERIVACVNFCNGVATEDLLRVGGAQ